MKHGLAHACFACACAEQAPLVRRARAATFRDCSRLGARLLLGSLASAAAARIVPDPDQAGSLGPLLELLGGSLLLLAKVLGTALAALGSLLAFNTLAIPRAKTDTTHQAAAHPEHDHYSQVLADAIRLETVSQDAGSDQETDPGPLRALHELLRKSFPRAHERLEVTQVNTYSLLYKWEGSDKSLKPIMLCAHLDVVPAPGEWEQPPFSGNIVDGVVWGRGAIDNKHNVVGELAAVEELLKGGFEPRRTVYVAFGHDEEISGFQGAK